MPDGGVPRVSPKRVVIGILAFIGATTILTLYVGSFLTAVVISAVGSVLLSQVPFQFP